MWICLATVALILHLGPNGQCLIQALGLSRHLWPWAVCKAIVYRGQVTP